jgi:LuxR family transcriptional activator of bioluminescence operon
LETQFTHIDGRFIPEFMRREVGMSVQSLAYEAAHGSFYAQAGTTGPATHSIDTKLSAAFELIDQAYGVKTQRELESLLAPALETYGIDRFAVNEIRVGKRQIFGRQRFGVPNQVWASHYLVSKLYLKDDVVQRAIKAPTPIWWNKMSEDSQVSAKTRRIFEEAREYQLEDGFVVPVHRADGSIAAVAFTAPNRLELSPADQACLRLIALYYQSFGELLASALRQTPRPLASLTRRQAECLQWVRQGKTSWEISMILGLSERTVIFHIEEACARLGVNNRTQAVIEALLQGHIQL